MRIGIGGGIPLIGGGISVGNGRVNAHGRLGPLSVGGGSSYRGRPSSNDGGESPDLDWLGPLVINLFLAAIALFVLAYGLGPVLIQVVVAGLAWWLALGIASIPYLSGKLRFLNIGPYLLALLTNAGAGFLLYYARGALLPNKYPETLYEFFLYFNGMSALFAIPNFVLTFLVCFVPSRSAVANGLSAKDLLSPIQTFKSQVRGEFAHFDFRSRESMWAWSDSAPQRLSTLVSVNGSRTVNSPPLAVVVFTRKVVIGFLALTRWRPESGLKKSDAPRHGEFGLNYEEGRDIFCWSPIPTGNPYGAFFTSFGNLILPSQLFIRRWLHLRNDHAINELSVPLVRPKPETESNPNPPTGDPRCLSHVVSLRKRILDQEKDQVDEN